jgi:type IV pilus assembly protein PilF
VKSIIMSRVFKTILLCFVTLFLVSACVTKTTKGNNRQVDKTRSLELHVKLAQGYISKGNRESARLHLGKAFDINKKSPEATQILALLYQLEGEPVLAEQTFLKAIKLKDNFSDARNSYGKFLFNDKRYEDALKQFEIAAADLAYDGRAEALVNVGRTSLYLGNSKRAKAAFEHAIILNRDLSVAYIELADMNLQAKEYADAKQLLDKYMSLNPATARALLIGIRLERIFGNKDKEASYLLMLKNKFPYSKEYLEYKETMTN